MNIPKIFKEELLKEFKENVKRIKEEKDVHKQLYYYSAIYGILDRIYRFHFDPEILFIYLVFNSTYNTMLQRIENIKRGDNTIPFRIDLLSKIADHIEEITLRIEKNEQCYDLLQKIVVLAYSTTGPGYYMLVKGQMKIE